MSFADHQIDRFRIKRIGMMDLMMMAHDEAVIDVMFGVWPKASGMCSLIYCITVQQRNKHY